MSRVSNEGYLVERHYATLVLRLLLDGHGRLVYGDVVEVGNGHLEHFAGDHGLIEAVRTWLSQHEKQYASREPPMPLL